MTRARRVTLALSALLLAAGCGNGGGGDDDASATAAEDTSAGDETSPTSAPTTSGDETSASSSGTSGDTADIGPVDYVADIQPIWDTSCVAGCHAPGGTATAGPLLAADKSYAMLVGQMSPTVVSLKLVEPGDPDASYLWHKLNGTQEDVGGGGLSMPFGATLDPEQLAKIEKWIEDGAQP